MTDEARKESVPMWYIATFKDMIVKIDMELETCKFDDYRINFRIIKRALMNLVDYYDDVNFIDFDKEKLK